MSNDIAVWAKLKYHSFWPARIVTPPPELQPAPPRKFCVQFFGTHDYGYPTIDNVKSYKQNRAKFSTKGARYGTAFKTAIKECDDFVQDPQNFCSVELEHLIIKQEPNYFLKIENDEYPQSRKNIIQRKKKVLECSNCSSLLCELETARSRQYELTSVNETFREEVRKLQSDADVKQSEYNVELSNLRAQLCALQSQHKQLQSDASEKRSDDNVFEVQAIIGHKKEKGKWMYNVHWHGFDIKESTWERRANLIGVEAFKEYLSKNGLK